MIVPIFTTCIDQVKARKIERKKELVYEIDWYVTKLLKKDCYVTAANRWMG